jgi:hypothetical protein
VVVRRALDGCCYKTVAIHPACYTAPGANHEFFLRSYFASPTAAALCVSLGLPAAYPFQDQKPTAAEMSKKETVASALLRTASLQEYEVRSAAEAMPENVYAYRPAEGKFKSEKPDFGPSEMRTFAEQVKHVACANFAFAAEFDGQQPPAACDKGGPDPAKNETRAADLSS